MMSMEDESPTWPAELVAQKTASSSTKSSKTHVRDVSAAEAQPLSRFAVNDKRFAQQFAAVYFTRLVTLRPAVIATIKKDIADMKEGPKPVFCKRVLDIRQSQLSVVVGTLYKDMKLRPSILDEYNKRKATAASRSHFMSPDDFLVLEDEYGRVRLTGAAEALPISQLTTGTVVGLLGEETTGGELEVKRLWYAGLPKQPPKPSVPSGRYVALISGLTMGDPSSDPLPLQMMTDYLTGYLGGETEQGFVAKISRVIIAGNSLYRTKDTTSGFHKKAAEDSKSSTLSPIKSLDLLLTQLAGSLAVDIMPGETDPSNYTLPQQPMHPCLFPSARAFSTLKTVTNPYLFKSEHGAVLLGTSGQTVQDLSRYSAAEKPIEFLERTLKYRHLAPTAPDTLACYPFQTEDPFVLHESPHVYFAGNAPHFDTRVCTGPEGQHVRLILVPSFVTSRTIVLLNMDDFSVHPISFGPPPAEPATAGGQQAAEHEGEAVNLDVDEADEELELEMVEEEAFDDGGDL